MPAPSPEEETLERSLARTPRQPDLWIRLGLARAQRGAEAGAEAAYRSVLEQDPGSSLAWQCLGLLREQQRRYDEAIDCFQAGVDRGGSRPALWANLAKLQHQTGRVEASRRSYEEAVRLDPANPFYREMLRKVTFLRDVLDGPSVDAAIAGYRSSLAPGSAATDRELRELFEALFAFLSAFGHREAALRLGRKHLELWPDSPWMPYLLQAVKGESGFDRSPPGYVAEHFDAFAAGFDAQLVGALGYDIPEKIVSALQAAGALGTPGDVVDAGCGTGLCAPGLRPFARTLTGVDLSPRMLELAAKRGGYDELACADLNDFLRRAPARFDLMVAADVLVYVGDLTAFFSAAAVALRPGGWLAFSTEREEQGTYRLRPSGRFGHAAAYVRGAAGGRFVEVACQETTIRLETTFRLPGQLFVFRRR
jgi:predicted TPR repeat methyltransferase